MAKFKKGDKVIISKEYGRPFTKDETGVVVGDPEEHGFDSSAVIIKVDNWKDGWGADRSMWAVREDYVRPSIQVGDTVKFVKKSIPYVDFPIGTKAKVIMVGSDMAVVQLFNIEHGFTYNDKPHCQHAPISDLELVNPAEKLKQNLVVYRKGNKVVAQLHQGKTVIASAEAVCSPNDDFDFLLGSQIALQRLYKKIGKEGKYALPEDTKMKDILAY